MGSIRIDLMLSEIYKTHTLLCNKSKIAKLEMQIDAGRVRPLIAESREQVYFTDDHTFDAK
jgi:hypothetical protein